MSHILQGQSFIGEPVLDKDIPGYDAEYISVLQGTVTAYHKLECSFWCYFYCLLNKSSI